MRRKGLIVVCIVSMLLSLIGCSSKKSTNDQKNSKVPMGRYVEQPAELPELSPEEQTIGTVCNASGQLEYYTYKQIRFDIIKVYCYVLVDDIYEKKTVDWASNAVKSIECKPVQMILGQDNNYYMLGKKSSSQDTQEDTESYESDYRLIQQDVGGENYIDVTPEVWKDNKYDSMKEIIKGAIINQIQVSENHTLCYQSDNLPDINLYDLDKKKELMQGSLQTGQAYAIRGNELYYISEDGTSVNCYDVGANKEKSIPVSSIKLPASLRISDTGDIYMVDGLGIHKYKAGGTMWETLVDGTLCSMSIPTYSMESFVIVPKEYSTFYVMFKSLSGNEETLFTKYCYDPTIEAAYTKELSIYSLWENKAIRQGIFAYMKGHTDTRINYIVANSDDSSATKSDQIRELNTEILSGKGADIIVLDGLPIKSYIDKGVLLDTSDIFSERINNGELFTNIASNYVDDGKIYAMPIRYYIPMYAMRKEMKDSVENTSTLAQSALESETPLFESLPYDTLLQMLLLTYSNEILESDGLINSAALSDFLENVKTIADQTDAGIDPNGEYGLIIGEGYNARISNFLCGSPAQLLISDVNAIMGYAGDMPDIQMYDSCLSKGVGIYKPVNQSFIPEGIVSINKSSKDVDLAKDFIKSLFTDEIQKEHLDGGFPVCTKALEEWIKEEPEEGYGFYLAIGDKQGSLHKVETQLLSVKEKESIYDMIRALTRPVYNDTISQEIIVEGGTTYLRGERTLDETVDDIVNKLNLYLNEQK